MHFASLSFFKLKCVFLCLKSFNLSSSHRKKPYIFPWISSLYISNNFQEPNVFPFHLGYNCVLLLQSSFVLHIIYHHFALLSVTSNISHSFTLRTWLTFLHASKAQVPSPVTIWKSAVPDTCILIFLGSCWVLLCCLLSAQVFVSGSSTLLHHLEVTSLLSSKCQIVIFLKTLIIPTRVLTGAGLPCLGQPTHWLGSAVVLSAHFSLLWNPCLCASLLAFKPQSLEAVALNFCLFYDLLCATNRLALRRED